MASLWNEAIEEKRIPLQSYETLCREFGLKPDGVALAWLLRNPLVTAPIIGPRTVGQLIQNAHALEIELSDDIVSQLDKIWPGPGQAPEAYAW